MDSQPNFKFTLISGLDLISTLGSVGVEWSQSGGGGAWTNGTGEIIYTNPTIPASPWLERAVDFTPGKRYLLVIHYTASSPMQIIIGHGGSPYDQYLFNADGAAGPSILTCDFLAYDNTPDLFTIQLKTYSPGAAFQFTFSNIRLTEVDGLQRVITPGGWKTLTKSLERIIGYWGFIESLEGELTIINDDLEWLRSYLSTQPDKQFKCQVENVLVDGSLEDYYTGLLDTQALNVSLQGVNLSDLPAGATGGRAYQLTLPFLKETEWSRFVSYLTKPIDFLSIKAASGLDVIESRGLPEQITPPGSLQPRFTYSFTGTAFPQTFSLAPDEVIYLGFGDNVTLNDGFEIFKGFSKQDTLVVPGVGGFKVLGGDLTVFYSGTGIGIEAILDDSGVYTSLVSGTPYSIILTEAFFVPAGVSGWHVKITNTDTVQRTVTITADSSLVVDAQIEYEMAPLARMPLLMLKAYAARILGDYDNISAEVFDDHFSANSSDINVTLEFQDPPPKHRPFNAATSGPQFPMGNYYSGGDATWAFTGGEAVLALGAGLLQSNVLLVRMVVNDPNILARTTYTTKGHYTSTITTTGSVAGHLEIVGIIDHEVTVLHTFTPVLGANVEEFDVDNYYEALGLRGSADAELSLSVVLFSYDTGDPQVVQGQYALNYISTGRFVRENTPTPDAVQESEFRPFNTLLDGLVKIFGLGLEPRTVNGKMQLYIVPQDEFFIEGAPTPDRVQINAEEFAIAMDNDLIRDFIIVGGPSRIELEVDQDASCAISNYISTYITTGAEFKLDFEICLNSMLILNQELSEEDLCLFEISDKDDPGGGTITYRTTNGITFGGSGGGGRQPNWLHQEGRIFRRNLTIISAMGSVMFNLIAGIASSRTSVDYAPDGLGPIANADPIFAEPKFTPWKVDLQTDMSIEKYDEVFANRYNEFTLIVSGVENNCFLKSARHNAASGKAVVTLWLKEPW